MLNSVLLQAEGAAWTNILMIVLLIGIFYLFMIRPQQKRQKEIRKFREGLAAGDSVVTAGGIYGKVRTVGETTFTIEIAKDVRITVDKGSVYPSAVQASQDAAQK
ncbi:MAG: preprotein translocase subunit YajC [Muribaculaceae bacterium]|jgi:preprotein translocase subunit YajC|nr:preprotein translocase subunit YajC [Muribaculaceae bacterium]